VCTYVLRTSTVPSGSWIRIAATVLIEEPGAAALAAPGRLLEFSGVAAVAGLARRVAAEDPEHEREQITIVPIEPLEVINHFKRNVVGPEIAVPLIVLDKHGPHPVQGGPEGLVQRLPRAIQRRRLSETPTARLENPHGACGAAVGTVHEGHCPSFLLGWRAAPGSGNL
jgi:hypothetical protein